MIVRPYSKLVCSLSLSRIIAFQMCCLLVTLIEPSYHGISRPKWSIDTSIEREPEPTSKECSYVFI